MGTLAGLGHTTPKGNFILPVSKTNEIVIKINKNKLDSILKMR